MAVVELTYAQEPGLPTTAWMRLNRPESRNALNSAMCRDLLMAISNLHGRSDVACAVLSAAGPVFCAGADLKERRSMSDDQIRGRRILAFRAFEALETLPMPVIAVVDGPCIGSGCEIATACDFVVASDRAHFRYPETQVGTVGATQRLPRIVGPRIAKELLYTGRQVSAVEARELRIVNRVVPTDALASTVEEIVGQIAKAPVAALRQAKRAIDRGVADSRYGALSHELLAIEENLDRQDWKGRMGAASRE
jgi:enoyl-CoA hydratase